MSNYSTIVVQHDNVSLSSLCIFVLFPFCIFCCIVRGTPFEEWYFFYMVLILRALRCYLNREEPSCNFFPLFDLTRNLPISSKHVSVGRSMTLDHTSLILGFGENTTASSLVVSDLVTYFLWCVWPCKVGSFTGK